MSCPYGTRRNHPGLIRGFLASDARASIAGGTLLEQAEAAGLAPAFGCRMGICRTCTCNVMHGQYDWMKDPALNSKAFEWDTACPGDQWRYSHNYMHHTHTNVLGKDRDIGYGILRAA